MLAARRHSKGGKYTVATAMPLLDSLPHQPPMRLVEELGDVIPGQRAVGRRVAKGEDFYFQGHFPDQPIVPAIILVELLAQTGGVAIASGEIDRPGAPIQLRVAGLGPFKFPGAAHPGATLEATARVVGRFGGVFKIDGTVTADGALVASGSVLLAG